MQTKPVIPRLNELAEKSGTVRHDHGSLAGWVGEGNHATVAQTSYRDASPKPRQTPEKQSANQAIAVAEIVTAGSKLTVATGYAPVMCYDPGVFDEQQSSHPAILHPGLAAGILRDQRLRDMLAAIAEFWRASGPDRAWWRQDALWRLQEWRRLYRIPERAAFDAAVRRSRLASAA